MVGRRVSKTGHVSRHMGVVASAAYQGKRGTTLDDFGRGHGMMTFKKKEIKPASRGLKARYGKISRANDRRISKHDPGRALGRKVGTGAGGRKRQRLYTPGGGGGIFNRLHPRGRGGRFIKKGRRG